VPDGASTAAEPTPPGAYGRRSRRGFYFQDACALLDCLDLLEGAWDCVTLEHFEDIICEAPGRVTSSVVVDEGGTT
jgi:hypothetical protein